MLEADVVAGRVGYRLEGTVIGRIGSGWVGRRLEGLDPDGLDVDWKG